MGLRAEYLYLPKGMPNIVVMLKMQYISHGQAAMAGGPAMTRQTFY